MTIKEITERHTLDDIDISELAQADLGPSAWERALDDAYLGRRPGKLSINEIITLDRGIELESLSY